MQKVYFSNPELKFTRRPATPKKNYCFLIFSKSLPVRLHSRRVFFKFSLVPTSEARNYYERHNKRTFWLQRPVQIQLKRPEKSIAIDVHFCFASQNVFSGTQENY